jgi:sucrose-phosphate synthase
VVHDQFSWTSHAKRYVTEVQRVLGAGVGSAATTRRSRLPGVDRLLVADIDDTLTGDKAGLETLMAKLNDAGDHVGFGIATGRTLAEATSMIASLDLPMPDLLITGTGTGLHYGERLTKDLSWERQIHYRWDLEAVRAAVDELPDLTPAGDDHQTPYRLRYVCQSGQPISLPGIRRHLRQKGLHATVILDHQIYLDVIPGRASPGLAIRFVGFKWELPPERMLVAGDSGNDADMLAGQALGVVVGNHTPELDRLRGRGRTYFATAHHAWGVIEGIDWYDFLGDIQPDREQQD